MYLAYGELDTLVPPAQAVPLALAYAAADQPKRAWGDHIEGLAHNVENGVNAAWLDLFLDLVLAGAAQEQP